MNKEEILCPGETIKELLEIYHYTQKDLADKLDMELKTVNEILNGKAVITVDTALKLEMIFNIDAIFWNNLEFNYRRKIKEIEDQELLEQEYQIVKAIYKEMVRRNLVAETKSKKEIVDNFKKFMEITSIKSLEQEYYKVACRKANTKNFNEIYLMVWIQIGLKKAREIKVEGYNKDNVLQNIEKIRKLTLMDNQVEARKKLLDICRQCGIILNFESAMPNTAIYGIAKWLDSNTPFIQISDRGKNLSTFWFSFMHELGHIVNGRKKMCFIDIEGRFVCDEEDVQILRDCEEFKADKFARNSLIPDKQYENFLSKININKISVDDIKMFAKQVNISPAIVAGRLKFDKNEYDNKALNHFNTKIEF